jgi:hypothetical protein
MDLHGQRNLIKNEIYKKCDFGNNGDVQKVTDSERIALPNAHVYAHLSNTRSERKCICDDIYSPNILSLVPADSEYFLADLKGPNKNSKQLGTTLGQKIYSSCGGIT